MRVRSVFISDVHLGSRGCHAELLVQFLQVVDSENLFLLGDIIDLEALARQLYWPESHMQALRAIIGKARRGTRVVYVPGNHDARFRAHCGRRLADVEIHRFFLFENARGKRYLLLHGDEFDGLVACGGWLTAVGAFAYRQVIRLNAQLNRLRARLGFPYWSFAGFVKHRFGSARQYMHRFREAVVRTARGMHLDGVICGHIHRPEQVSLRDLEYLNTGDWIESCTAIVEHLDGRLELICWPERLAALERTEPALSQAA